MIKQFKKKCPLHFLLVLTLAFQLGSCSKEPQPEPTPPEPMSYTIIHEPELCDFDRFLHECVEGYRRGGAIMDSMIRIIEQYGPIDKDKQVWLYDIEYPSVNEKNEKIKLSGRIYIPIDVLSGDTTTCLSLVSHHLILADKYCPTKKCIYEAIPAWCGHTIIVPDQIGFGSGVNQNLYISNSNFLAQGCVECMQAAILLLKDLGVEYDENLYNFGYSQGGAVAMANLAYTAKHPECGIKFYKTFAGAGAYDPALSFKKYLEGDCQDAQMFGAVGLVSLVSESNGELDPKEIFKEPFLSAYDTLILSKKYDVLEINEVLDTLTLKDCIQDGIIYRTTNAGKKVESLSLLRRTYCGWDIPQGSMLYVFGPEDDDFVPYANYVSASYFLENTQSDTQLVCHSEKTLGHVTGIFAFSKWVIENWQ